MSAGPYVPLQATFFQDDRIILCSPLAKLVYLQGLCIAKLMGTDGIVTLAQLKRECDGIRRIDRYISELVGHGLWTEVSASAAQRVHKDVTSAAQRVHKDVTSAAQRVHKDVTSAHEADMIAYATTAWLRHNWSRERIEEYRTARAEDGKRGGRPPKSPLPPDDAPKGNPFESEKGNPFENPENKKGTENLIDLKGRQTEEREKTTTETAPDPIPANDSQEDDPRLDVVCRLSAKRATNKAGEIGTTRARYEKGALKNIMAERGDEIRSLLRDRPSASAEQIVDLLERGNGYQATRRDPEANRGMFDGIPEPVRASWVDNPAPLPPELLARARHEEDELEEVAS
jgi:hypothetical protein